MVSRDDFFESLTKAAKITIVFAVGATALWLFAVPTSEAWIRELAVRPAYIPFWKRLLMGLAQGWPIVWPALVVFVWVITFLPIELWRRIKARRP